MSWIGRAFDSFGLKRKAAAAVAALIGAMLADPTMAPYVPYVQYVAGALGLAGLVHGGVTGTLAHFSTASLVSLLTLIATILQHDPRYAGYVLLLQAVTGVLGGAAVGVATGKTQVIKQLEQEVSVPEKVISKLDDRVGPVEKTPSL